MSALSFNCGIADWRRVRLNGISSLEIVGGDLACHARLSKHIFIRGRFIICRKLL